LAHTAHVPLVMKYLAARGAAGPQPTESPPTGSHSARACRQARPARLGKRRRPAVHGVAGLALVDHVISREVDLAVERRDDRLDAAGRAVAEEGHTRDHQPVPEDLDLEPEKGTLVTISRCRKILISSLSDREQAIPQRSAVILCHSRDV